MDKTILNFAKFCGFKPPSSDLSERELIRKYMKEHGLNEEEAKMWIDELLADSVQDFFYAKFGPAKPENE
jgi:hypothetical protein